MKSTLNNVFVELTVRSMLNPNNKDFYIGNLTVDKVNRLLHNTHEKLVDAFWTAFGIAHSKFVKEKIELEAEREQMLEALHDKHIKMVCPMCACSEAQGYTEDCACPNCEYIEC